MDLVMHMQHSPELCQALREDISQLFSDKSFLRVLTEMGISRGESLFAEAKLRLLAKILPEHRDRLDANFWIDKLFDHPQDHLWVSHIKNEGWSRFLLLLGFKELHRLDIKIPLMRQTLNAIRIISLRLDALSLNRDIIDKLPEIEKFESPFVMQHQEVVHYLEKYLKEGFDRTTDNTDYKQIMVLIDQCEGYVSKLRDRKRHFGVSSRFTNYLIRLGQNVKRIRMLFFLVTTHENEIDFQEEINFFKAFLYKRKLETSLRQLFSENLSFISYQITQYTGSTGEKYITTSYADYFKMLLSSCKGGLIVALMCFVKLGVYFLNLPLFGTALGYSLNYGFGFIVIHITGSKLATKQPAMTASKLASVIDESEAQKKDELTELAEVIRLIVRSQFIAFLGNVLISFCVAFLIGFAYLYFNDKPIVNFVKANEMLMEHHPTRSLSIFYAALAGFFLFLSGLIAGYADNFSIIHKIPERLKFQPFLRQYLSPRTLVSFSDYMSANFGQLCGNFALGVFLGTTSTIGKILGLPLDIRHITFAAGNIGIALSSLEQELYHHYISAALSGVALIGLMNFVFSFSPSLYVAIKSRQVNFRRYGQLAKVVAVMFFKSPFSFFLPIKSKQQEENLAN